jgi:hypothetical protein
MIVLFANYEQIADSLPTKTIPTRSNAAHQTRTKTKSKKQKRTEKSSSVDISTTPTTSKRPRVTIEEVDDDEADGGRASAPPAISNISQIPKVCPYIQTFHQRVLTLPSGKRADKSNLSFL